MLFKKIFTLFICCTLILSACSTKIGAGAAAGTAGGALIGAIAGAVISRGDIATSALLGGAIGLPLGLAIGYALQRKDENRIAKNKVDVYLRNQEMIVEREREIESLRNDILNDAPTGSPDYDTREHLYMGVSLGSPTR